MSSQIEALPTDGAAIAPRAAPRARGGMAPVAHLFHPVVDFLCLGGGTLLVLPLVLLLPDSTQAPVATLMLLLAHAINHPHFAHSYQIFYRHFPRKAFGSSYNSALRARYVFAGLVAPLALLTFFAVGAIQPDPKLLGYGANVMGFLVGWHYVKQGYGMLIVDSVLKRRFFDPAEKRAFVWHAYSVWMFSWMAINTSVSQHDLWGLKYYSFAFPAVALGAVGAAMAVTGLLVLWTLIKKWRVKGERPPITGLVAYVVTLYLWMVLVWIDPKFLLIVPAMHSLQYLLVVWRYQLNVERGRAPRSDETRLNGVRGALPSVASRRFLGFVGRGVALGFLGFWVLPIVLAVVVPYDQEVFGPTMFLFIFWVFINVHHYFLDNVMWRGENPDTRKYLFAHR